MQTYLQLEGFFFLCNVTSYTQHLLLLICYLNLPFLETSGENLVTLNYSCATAILQDDGSIYCQYEILSPIGKLAYACVQIIVIWFVLFVFYIT